MALNKLAKIMMISTAIGGISLVGVKYASESTDIQKAVADLKQKALDWQKRAGINKAELNAMTDEYNTLEANYKAILSILKIDDNADIEEVKERVQGIYDNATSTGIEGTNIMLESIANALGITLTDDDKNENGVYKTDIIIEELETLDNKIDELQMALGQLEDGQIVINKNASDIEYSDDLSLSEKINYLISQINLANKEQSEMKVYVQEALDSVDEASADYVYEEENEGGASGVRPPQVEDDNEEEKAQAETNLRTALKNAGKSDTIINKLISGEYTTKYENEKLMYQVGIAMGTPQFEEASGDLQTAFETWLALK